MPLEGYTVEHTADNKLFWSGQGEGMRSTGCNQICAMPTRHVVYAAF